MAVKNRSSKLFVIVDSKPSADGWKTPIELSYNDEKFEIKDPIRSMKYFNNAVRYKCNIDGKAIELFNEDEEWWMLR